jgi:hypothetical protein
MSLSLTRIDSTEPPTGPGWLRRRRGLVIGIVIGSLVALGGWRLVVAIQKVRIAASRSSDT